MLKRAEEQGDEVDVSMGPLTERTGDGLLMSLFARELRKTDMNGWAQFQQEEFAASASSIFDLYLLYSLCVQRSSNTNKHAEIWVDKKFMTLSLSCT